MNILYLEHYASPDDWGMEHRPFRFARRWAAMGHKVVILAASYTHLRVKNPVFAGPFLRREIDGVTFLFVKTPAYEGNGTARCRNIAAFLWGVWNRYDQMTGGFSPDVILLGSTYLLDVYPALSIARRYGARLLYELHDLWSMSVEQLGGYGKGHPIIRLLQKAEDRTIASCEAVVSMLPGALPHLVEHGLEPDRFFYIPNTAEIPREAPVSSPLADKLRQWKREGHFLIGYTGALGLANAVWVLVEAAARLKGQAVKVVLIGRGSEKPALQRLIRRKGLMEIVQVWPPVPHEEITHLLPLFDALFIGLQKKPLFRYGISPNKLMDYMAAARPVIFSVDCPKNPVADCGCGLVVPPEDPKKTASAIERLRHMSEEERKHMGERGRRYMRLHHHEEHLAARYLTVLERFAPRQPGHFSEKNQ